MRPFTYAGVIVERECLAARAIKDVDRCRLQGSRSRMYSGRTESDIPCLKL